MGRIKRGFNKGSIVVCIEDEFQIGRRFITVGEEYTVLSYSHKPNKSSIFNSEHFPQIMIKVDNILKNISCSHFMPKDEYVRKIRNDKLSQII